MRALSGVQYDNTLKAIFGTAATTKAALLPAFAASDRAGAFSTSADVRRFDFEATRTVMANAEGMALASLPAVKTRFPCLSAPAPDAACATTFTRELGRDVYRLPLTAAETQPLVQLFSAARTRAGTDAAVTLTVRALLSSPRFLFRRELGVATGPRYRLGPHEIAEALAFTLSNGPPDLDLRKAADAGQLTTPEQVRAQAQRLGRTAAGPEAFLRELFYADEFLSVPKDAKAFPTFDGRTRRAVLDDWNATLSATLQSEAPTLQSLLVGRRQVVRPETARLLGWDDAGRLPAGGQLLEPTERERLGLVTHPMMMANLAHDLDSNPVRRGHFVSDRLLCLTVPPPPDAVDLPDISGRTGKTLRQIIEESHSVASCAGCHRLMDPLGFPMEIFDAVGRRRTTDRGLPIDPRGGIVGTGELDGPVPDVTVLLERVASSRTAHTCFARQAFKYVSGDEGDDECRAGLFAPKFVSGGGDVRVLFAEMLSSAVFLERM